jgi:RNA polymerase sigma-70 factor (ECF subfamily)
MLRKRERRMKSDFELLTAFKAGDMEAFHRLARRHHVTIYNFFYMLTGSEGAAEDLTRRVFTQMATERHRLPLDRKFATSLYRFGYRHWILYAQSEAAVSSTTHLLPGPAPVLDAEAQDRAAADRLLNSLATEQRLIVVLSETNGLSYHEISEIVDISEEAVRRRMAEAMTQLRNAREMNLASVADVNPQSATRPQ